MLLHTPLPQEDLQPHGGAPLILRSTPAILFPWHQTPNDVPLATKLLGALCHVQTICRRIRVSELDEKHTRQVDHERQGSSAAELPHLSAVASSRRPFIGGQPQVLVSSANSGALSDSVGLEGSSHESNSRGNSVQLRGDTIRTIMSG
jgi:hypothetical protein